MEEIKKFIQKMGLLRLMLVIVCGVLLLFLSYPGHEAEPDIQSANSTSVQTAETVTLEDYKRAREEELEQLLQKVEGVGQVEANEEKTVLVENSDRDSSPYIVQEREPEIEGVVIVCQGGYDSVIKREITDAVSALFSIESHKIKIMKSKEAKE